jgi:hypothetical protein
VFFLLERMQSNTRILKVVYVIDTYIWEYPIIDPIIMRLVRRNFINISPRRTSDKLGLGDELFIVLSHYFGRIRTSLKVKVY